MFVIICAVIFGVICIALVNISRDLKSTRALMINGYYVSSRDGYRVIRLYEYSVNDKEYVNKTISKEYDKETADYLSGQGVGELVDINYELYNHRNIYEKNA